MASTVRIRPSMYARVLYRHTLFKAAKHPFWVHVQVAHLEQAEVRRGSGGLAARSFLGGLLPESLVHVLQGGGPAAFAAALAGDSDTPELIWTHRMRGQRLVPQVGICSCNPAPAASTHCHSGPNTLDFGFGAPGQFAPVQTSSTLMLCYAWIA